ncbi:MAG: choice-of-anchor Q domain-containing protein [Dokdonella sp.]
MFSGTRIVYAIVEVTVRSVVLLLLFLMSVPASATSFYIDPVNGSNGGNGSAAQPWKSLQSVFDAGLIATQDWSSYPYAAGMSLVPVHPTAPVHAGDTLWLRSGYHGDLVIMHAYNSAPITIAPQPGQTPQVRSLRVQAAQNWIVRDLAISPSYAPSNAHITMAQVSDHTYFGPTSDIELANLDLFSVADASSWGAVEWINLASDGVEIDATRISLHDSRLRNVRFGISVDGTHASIRHNLIDGFSGDGMRGLGDYGLFEYNRVQNDYIGDPPDANHDDGFQSWSIGSDGQVGTGQVTGVTLRGNVFINATDPNNPLRNSMQGIGCFDGFFVNWVVENNVVITDHWHGISFYGMRDSRIVNNTVIDLAGGQPGPPWIMVHAHKDGRPSTNVVVRNNLSTDYSIEGTSITNDYNVLIGNPAALFVAPPFDLHLVPGAAAIDAGSATFAPLLDADGVTRPQGAGIDLGAYEWRANVIFRNGFENT